MTEQTPPPSQSRFRGEPVHSGGVYPPPPPDHDTGDSAGPRGRGLGGLAKTAAKAVVFGVVLGWAVIRRGTQV